MPPLQPEQAAFLLQRALPALKGEHRITHKVIAAIPLDKGDYRPDGVSKSALDLAWHIATAEIFFTDAVISGEFNLTPRPRPESIRNSADLAAWYDEAFQPIFYRLAELTPEHLLKTLDFRGVFRYPAVTYLQFSLNHTIHHRGQLSTYLRPMGAQVPSIYGDSHDDAQARQAA